jgi:hypothetical protein
LTGRELRFARLKNKDQGSLSVDIYRYTDIYKYPIRQARLHILSEVRELCDGLLCRASEKKRTRIDPGPRFPESNKISFLSRPALLSEVLI